MIDVLVEFAVLPVGKGGSAFNPERVRVKWKRAIGLPEDLLTYRQFKAMRIEVEISSDVLMRVRASHVQRCARQIHADVDLPAQ